MSTQKDPGFGRGLFYGFGAYLIWGSFPIIITALNFVSPWEIVGWRILFGFVLAAVILTFGKSWKQVVRIFKEPKMLIWNLFATGLIFINWSVYVIAVASQQTLEASLGYFINPLVTIFLAVIFLGEKLSKLQWVASALGLVAVAVLTIDYGRLPWMAFLLALSFGLYGLAKNKIGGQITAVNSYAMESGMLVPVAGIILFLVYLDDGLKFGNAGVAGSLGLVAFGFLTAIPLILFGSAAKRLPLRFVGFMQYLTPILQFTTAVFILKEPMPPARLAGFVLVWVGLTVLIADAIRAGKQQKAQK
jgi:chloramphenicol-sensitive protein RarD